MIGSSQARLGKLDLASREVSFCKFRDNCRLSPCFGGNPRWKKAGIRFTLKGLRAEAVREERQPAYGKRSKSVSFSILLCVVCGACFISERKWIIY